MRISVRHIQETVAEHFEVAPNEMVQPRRYPQHPTNLPRHVAMFFARETTEHSWAAIARMFNRKNHTTVWHAHQKIERMIAENDAFAQDIKALAEVIGSDETKPVDKPHQEAFVAASASA